MESLRRFLWILVAAAVLLSLGIAWQRMSLERGQTTVELVYDYKALEHAAKHSEREVSDLLAELKASGVTTIAIPPFSLLEGALQGEILASDVRLYLEEHGHELDLLWDMPLSFPQTAFAEVEKAGLAAAPRLGNAPWVLPTNWLDSSPRLVILGGKESPGYPHNLEQYAQYFAEHGIRVGVVEFAQQKGVSQLGSAGQMVRVHGINQREMEKLTPERITERYLRGVRERNIRVLYLRPFLEGENSWARSMDVLSDLIDSLQDAGYQVGESEPFPNWQVPFWIKTILWAGIWAAAVLFAQYWLKLPDLILLLGTALGLALTIGLAQKNLHLAQEGMAFLAAVVFACLALQLRPTRSTLVSYVLTSAIAVAGGFLVAACLAGTEYLIKLAEFRGVKAMHVLPIAIAALGVVLHPVLPITSWAKLRGRLSHFWNLAIPLKLLIVGGTGLVVAMAVYVLRTGNFGLPIAQLEVLLRETLERVLVVRPRTKEFLIGHPALYFVLKDRRGKASWLAPIAVIGQLSMVNTFSHIHTPIIVTLVRTGYGLVFGYIMGWIAYRLYQFGKGLLQSDRGFWISRLWQSGR